MAEPSIVKEERPTTLRRPRAAGAAKAAISADDSRVRARGKGTTPQIRMVIPDSLRPNPRNSRLHTPEHIAQIIASIQRFGFLSPVLVGPREVILAGHGRWQAALEMGLAQIPVVTVSHLTADERRAFLIADNQIALNSAWDEGVRKAELTELQASGFDLSVIGVPKADLRAIFAPDNRGLAALRGDAIPPKADDEGDVEPAPLAVLAKAAAKSGVSAPTCPHCGKLL